MGDVECGPTWNCRPKGGRGPAPGHGTQLTKQAGWGAGAAQMTFHTGRLLEVKE